VDSKVGVGSTFFAVLPRQFGLDAAPAESERSSAGRPEVLVVEDDAGDAETRVEILKDGGYDVTLARRGGTAIDLIRTRRFDAVTLDLLLPDMAGWDVLAEIRGSDLNRDTPVIVVTVVPGTQSAHGFRIDGSIEKPVEKSQLMKALSRVGARPNLSKRVLVIEDDATMAKLMRTSLTDLGYLPICVGSAESGVEAVRDDRPDVIILDYMLPGMSGMAFLSAFRENPENDEVPVIVWTNRDLTTDELTRLRSMETQVVLKRQGGIRPLLDEIRAQMEGVELSVAEKLDNTGD
jgi:CheY-like chemotaxis protein